MMVVVVKFLPQLRSWWWNNQEIVKVMKKIHKMNITCVSIQIEDILFNIEKSEQKKRCHDCGKEGHYMKDCPNKLTPKGNKRVVKLSILKQQKLGWSIMWRWRPREEIWPLAFIAAHVFHLVRKSFSVTRVLSPFEPILYTVTYLIV